MTEKHKEILKQARLFTDLESIDDEMLGFIIKSVEQQILNYTNQHTMPQALVYSVWIPMVVDGAKHYVALSSTGVGEAKSVSEEGVSVTFSSPADIIGVLEKLQNKYISQMNTHRRLFRAAKG
ncbi:MAG: hypothetical protein FWG63_03695 [Defluviitaleaceae bacterium]|nr:hypothetical protein [Defluviitaleaceae bacterium]